MTTAEKFQKSLDAMMLASKDAPVIVCRGDLTPQGELWTPNKGRVQAVKRELKHSILIDSSLRGLVAYEFLLGYGEELIGQESSRIPSQNAIEHIVHPLNDLKKQYGLPANLFFYMKPAHNNGLAALANYR